MARRPGGSSHRQPSRLGQRKEQEKGVGQQQLSTGQRIGTKAIGFMSHAHAHINNAHSLCGERRAVETAAGARLQLRGVSKESLRDLPLHAWKGCEMMAWQDTTSEGVC